jgi:hypothetical protein
MKSSWTSNVSSQLNSILEFACGALNRIKYQNSGTLVSTSGTYWIALAKEDSNNGSVWGIQNLSWSQGWKLNLRVPWLVGRKSFLWWKNCVIPKLSSRVSPSFYFLGMNKLRELLNVSAIGRMQTSKQLSTCSVVCKWGTKLQIGLGSFAALQRRMHLLLSSHGAWIER